MQVGVKDSGSVDVDPLVPLEVTGDERIEGGERRGGGVLKLQLMSQPAAACCHVFINHWV